MRILLAALTLVIAVNHAGARQPPNIVIIYADDLGYGDVGCYGATCVETPNIDRLARQGLTFTDAHSASATCTPSRYALLTGEYPWRKKGTGVLSGSAGLIIEPGRVTLASMLNEADYATGMIGKWHLGLGDGTIDWNGAITPGPLEVGFDEAFIIPATGDRVPTVFVKNHHVMGLDPDDPIQVSYGKPVGDGPTGKENPELLKQHPSHGHDQTIVNGISRIGYMSGGKSARWVDEEIADVITGEAVDFIDRHQAEPFFLFFSTHDVHVPRAPHPRFIGKSDCGSRGDAIAELDWSVGEILKALDENQLAERTLVIFTSDNGPIVDDGYKDGALKNLGEHDPTGPLRGNKYVVYEGGTRVPFIARWPGHIEPGGRSDALLCQIDLARSLARLIGADVPQNAFPDSESLMDAFLGRTKRGRETLVEDGIGLALRRGSWKYIPAQRGRKRAGWGAKPWDGPGAKAELYNLATDLGEQTNLIQEHSDVATAMEARLREIRGGE